MSICLPATNIESPRIFLGLCVGTALLIALGGGTHPITLGAMAVALGVAFMAYPPNSRIQSNVGFCWLALFIWIFLSIWIPSNLADWRLTAEDLSIPISSSTSPQPWVTLEGLFPFLTGSAFFAMALATRPVGYERKFCVHVLAGALLILGLGGIFASILGLRLPWADFVQVFSWFPNRNQTGLVFASGSVLFFGLALVAPYRNRLQQALRKTQSSPLIRVYGASSLQFLFGCLLLYATFQTTSKGALVAWSSGMVTLLLLQAKSGKRFSTRLLRFAPALAFILFAFFVFFGGEARDRMMDFLALLSDDLTEETNTPPDFRWLIYKDTLSMIADQPVTGVGLGQFSYVFPQYRSDSVAPRTILHPESDWLWWVAEIGLFGLSLVVICFGALLLQLRRPKNVVVQDFEHYDNSIDELYRLIALAALVPFFAHSFVDVGAHRLGTVLLAIVLFALALPYQNNPSSERKLVRQFWRGGGAVLFCAGLGILTLTAFQSPLLGTYASEAKEPLATRPLQWQPYFRSAVQTYNEDPQAAMHSFEKAQFLVPTSPEIPLREGLFLVAMDDFPRAFRAFESALERTRTPIETYRLILQKTASNPIHYSRLRELAGTDEELIAAYWMALPSGSVDTEEEMPKLRTDWEVLPAATQRSILEKLKQRRSYDRVLSLFDLSLTENQEQTWSTAMQALVGKGRYEEALSLFETRVEPIPLPDQVLTDYELKRLRALTLTQSEDPVLALRLLQAYLSSERWHDAYRTAKRLQELPGRPPETLYWLGFASAKTNQKADAAQGYAKWLSERSN
ncbi:MAG: O-antigen ligase family protein [Verrucomicrobiota bacterium]